MNKVLIFAMAFLALITIVNLLAVKGKHKGIGLGQPEVKKEGQEPIDKYCYTICISMEDAADDSFGFTTTPLPPLEYEFEEQELQNATRNHNIFPRFFPNLDGLTSKLNDIADNVREINKKIKTP